jgi:hypothetical protein
MDIMTTVPPYPSRLAERAAEWLRSIDVTDMQTLVEWVRSGPTLAERRRRLSQARAAMYDALSAAEPVPLLHGDRDPRQPTTEENP